MPNKLVSVVIPAFNAEVTIQNTIRSVISQDYSAIELVVIDDGSSDKTISKVWEMRKECNERGITINLIAQRNAGVSHARNRGVKEAKAEYIAFLDADDQWLPEKLSRHLVHLNSNPKIGLSFARVNYLTPKGEPRKGSILHNIKVSSQDCLSDNPTISPSNWVIRKSAFSSIQGFDTTMTHAEDQEFLIRLIEETEFDVEGLDEVLVNYATSLDGLSSDIDAMYEGWMQLIEGIQKSKPANQFGQAYFDYGELRQRYCLYLTRRTMQTKQSALKAWGYFFKSIVSSPRSAILSPKMPSYLLIGLSFYSLSKITSTLKRTKLIATNEVHKAKTKEVNNV